MTKYYVATAGWNVPRELRQAAPTGETVLQTYAGQLGAVEINSTFYRRHRASTFERWRASVPDGFRFSVKIPRSISHEAALRDCDADLDEFLGDISALKSALGPLLLQLPGSQAFERSVAAKFFARLRLKFAGLVACEPRHASWYDSPATEIFEDYRIARVIADPPRPAAATLPAGSSTLRYVRWHGSPRVYWSEYGEPRLLELRQRLEQYPSHGETWCVFDNTAAGAAFVDARRFQELQGLEI